MEFIENLSGLSEEKLNTFLASILDTLGDAKKILVIHPDYTRTDFTDKIVPLVVEKLRKAGVKKIDFLNAAGTHRKMAESEFLKKLGLDSKASCFSFNNHQHDEPERLKTIGSIPGNLVREKTGNQLTSSIPVTINKILLSSYDVIIAISGTAPHETAGYSGGLKIFFPGVSGPQVIDLFHWTAALIDLPAIIGTVDNNARDIINAGAKVIFERVKPPIYSFNMVNIEKESKVIPIGLYIDSGYEGFLKTYRAASLASSRVHVKYIDSPLFQAVQAIPDSYDEIWTAGKGSYKLQKPGVMAKGGEIILYAPHIDCFHSKENINAELLELGYHCKDNICQYLKSNTKVCKNSAAHVINVVGPGVFDPETGREELAFKVTLATAIPEEICRSVGLGYRNPKSIKRKDFTGPGKLWIEEGGKYLYSLKKGGKIWS